MQKINPEVVKSMSSGELINLWDSGLGRCFCENNKDDIDVLSIKNNIEFYNKRGRNTVLFSLFNFFISIAIFLITYFVIGYVDFSNVGLLAIFSGVACFVFILLGIKKIIKAKVLFESAKKLSNYDLSGFDIEDYAPNRKRLIHKSIEWGLVENKFVMENGKIKDINTPFMPSEKHKI